MHRSAALLALMSVACAACSSPHPVSSQASPKATAPSFASPSRWIANGRLIFQTGRDAHAVQIVASPPALYPKCAACHRADGSGGMHLPGGAVSADLRRKALVTDQKPPYTLSLVERAISNGIDNQGQPLNKVMPHWKLSSTDLHDVAYYVLNELK